MKEESRTLKSSKNALLAIICQSITIILSFITRSIFINYLSKELLGLNGVFSNVISFLSLAELGVGNVLLYNLYKPLKENDEKKIIQILNLFKRMYTFIALIIFIVGIIFIPFLPSILNGITFNLKVVIIYLLFLINTICSYLYAYKSFLLTADQKNYIISKITIFTTIIKECIQILVLILFKNFYLFLITTIVTTILKNILINKKCNESFTNLNQKQEELSEESKKRIFSDFKDIFLYKIANVALYSTDNLLISSLLNKGTILVGIYSNYLLITEALNKLISSVFQAFTASIGNLNTGNDNEKKYTIFKSLNFMSYWIYGVCCTCLFLLLNPFINIFAGSDYLFSKSIVLIIILSFYVEGTFTPIWIFRETTGIFKKSKYAALALAILNIILSIILGKLFGVIGILGATIISRLITTYWYEPYVIMKSYLKKSYINHIKDNLEFFIKNIITCLLTAFIFKNIIITNYLSFIIYGVLIFIVSNIILLILNFYKTEFKFLLQKANIILSRSKTRM